MRRRAKNRWIGGNRATLLENGEAYFPAVFEAIRNAHSEVLLETFILFEDKVGHELQQTLIAAAQRGVQIDMLVDGFGSSDLSAEYLGPLLDAGVRVRSFDPSVRVLGVRFNVLRRMHRKLVIVDGQRAFVGGINFSADHLGDFGPEAKQDFSVGLEGPIVDEIRRFALEVISDDARRLRQPKPETAHPPPGERDAGAVDAIFIRRDNHEHRNDIERYYRIAIRAARKRVIIANAYFFPGYRLLKELRRAARRGVDVRLILQGEPDVPLARTAATLLYAHLQRAGVHIHEYCDRPLHGKVALVDDDWSTVGSSNLDPLSLALNLEANVVLRDRAFNAELRGRLEQLIECSCTEIPMPQGHNRTWWSQVRAFFVFHFLRSFSTWASWLPRHAPSLAPPIGASAVQQRSPSQEQRPAAGTASDSGPPRAGA